MLFRYCAGFVSVLPGECRVSCGEAEFSSVSIDPSQWFSWETKRLEAVIFSKGASTKKTTTKYRVKRLNSVRYQCDISVFPY